MHFSREITSASQEEILAVLKCTHLWITKNKTKSKTEETIPIHLKHWLQLCLL